MELALKLAERGFASVEPNPMVGCVIIKDDKIIGEGWHKNLGGPHAEINALNNAKKNSDIDLLIITSKNTLWTTRIISFALLKFAGFKLRRAGDKNEKDKLCLNMWLDESDLVLKKRNI